MTKHQILKEFSFTSKRKLFFIIKISFLVILVVGLGIYIGDLLFGKNSLEVLLGLDEQKSVLQQDIKKYKHDNAVLQKNYFELLQLEPTDK